MVAILQHATTEIVEGWSQKLFSNDSLKQTHTDCSTLIALPTPKTTIPFGKLTKAFEMWTYCFFISISCRKRSAEQAWNDPKTCFCRIRWWPCDGRHTFPSHFRKKRKIKLRKITRKCWYCDQQIVGAIDAFQKITGRNQIKYRKHQGRERSDHSKDNVSVDFAGATALNGWHRLWAKYFTSTGF